VGQRQSSGTALQHLVRGGSGGGGAAEQGEYRCFMFPHYLRHHPCPAMFHPPAVCDRVIRLDANLRRICYSAPPTCAFRPPPLPSSHLPPSTRLSWLRRTADTNIHFLYALTRTTCLFTNSYSFTHILVQQAVLPILSLPTLILVQQSVLLIP